MTLSLFNSQGISNTAISPSQARKGRNHRAIPPNGAERQGSERFRNLPTVTQHHWAQPDLDLLTELDLA